MNTRVEVKVWFKATIPEGICVEELQIKEQLKSGKFQIESVKIRKLEGNKNGD